MTSAAPTPGLSGDCTLLCGSAVKMLKTLPGASVSCVVTSPPYWGLRDYGVTGQIGQEPTPALFVRKLVSVFDEVFRVLRDDGTLWLNLGDSYASGNKGGKWDEGRSRNSPKQTTPSHHYAQQSNRRALPGLKEKDLIGIPWLVAFALQRRGWYLRSDVIWAKANPMPESVTDRPTSAHEHVFLLTKRSRYFYDADAIREPQTGNAHARGNGITPKSAPAGEGIKANDSFHAATSAYVDIPGGRNRRDVWTIAGQPFSEAHFATFPEALVGPCILAGSPTALCEACGAPWQRLTDTERYKAKDGKNALRGQGHYRTTRGGPANRQGREWLRISSVTTRGFESSCDCAAAAIPSTVLDPFAGSGTVGVVALRHGRRFIGIDLNAEYVAMARRRIDASLNADNVLPGAAIRVLDGQLSLLEAVV